MNMDRVVVHEIADRETERMEHHRIRDAVPVGTVEDAGLRLHAASLLVARELAKCHRVFAHTVPQ